MAVNKYILKVLAGFLIINCFAWGMFFNLAGFCPTENQALRRVRDVALSPRAEELKAILDDDSVKEITDEKLLVGGILDELLKINTRYKDTYKKKAEGILLEIYKAVREQGFTFNRYRRIFTGKQGFINGAIMVRDAIQRLLGPIPSNDEERQEFIERIPGGWRNWLARDEVKLTSLLNNFKANDLIIESLSKELYDPLRSDKFHILHVWEIIKGINWESEEGERIAWQAIGHVVEDHEELILDENLPRAINNWSDWAEKYGLKRMFTSKFGDSAREMFRFRYPKKFYNPQKPMEPHIWHDWDFQPSAWTDELISNAIRHNIEDEMHGEGWKVDRSLASRINSWTNWFQDKNLAGLLNNRRFKGSVAKVFKVVYPEAFKSGILKETDFKLPGATKKLFYYPVELKEHNRQVVKGFGNVIYHLGVKYKGYWVNKLTDDYAGLWKKRDSRLLLINVFPLIKYSGTRMLNINVPETQQLLQPVPQELANVLDRLTRMSAEPLYSAGEIESALRILVAMGINDPNKLSLAKQTVLLFILTQPSLGETWLRERYLSQFPQGQGLAALKVLAGQSDPMWAINLIDAFTNWKDAFLRYARIDDLAKRFSNAFGTKAMRLKGAEHKYKQLKAEDKIDPAQIREFKAEALEISELGVIDSFVKANNQIMQLLAENKDNPTQRKMILSLQEKLETVAQFLFDFSEGNLEFVREEAGGSIAWFRKDGHQIRLILRPEETDVEAAIRFSIDPVGMKSWAGFRIDRVYNEKLGRYNLTIDIDLGDEAQGLYDHHYPLMTSHQLHLANAELFSWLVRMVW